MTSEAFEGAGTTGPQWHSSCIYGALGHERPEPSGRSDCIIIDSHEEVPWGRHVRQAAYPRRPLSG
jgi:hypothetical protein